MWLDLQRYNYEYFEIINSRMHKAACAQFSTNLQSFMVFQTPLMNSLFELSANLDSLFHKVVNTQALL